MTLDELLALRPGDDFTYRGRSFTFYGSEGWTWGADRIGEYARVPVFKKGGGKTFVTVRPEEFR